MIIDVEGSDSFEREDRTVPLLLRRKLKGATPSSAWQYRTPFSSISGFSRLDCIKAHSCRSSRQSWSSTFGSSVPSNPRTSSSWSVILYAGSRTPRSSNRSYSQRSNKLGRPLRNPQGNKTLSYRICLDSKHILSHPNLMNLKNIINR
jgi:hypothetical protein